MFILKKHSVPTINHSNYNYLSKCKTNSTHCFLYQAYRKGRSPQSALMKRIERQLPWCSHKDKLEPIHRPDIHDHKTVDWIAVTGHSKDEGTRI